MGPNSKVRYVESILEGQIRCTDGTLVVFVPYKDEGEPPTAPVPARPRPGPPPVAARRG